MEPTIPLRPANRQAKQDRLRGFEALEEFANLEYNPKRWEECKGRWEQFKKRRPDFFPPDLGTEYCELSVPWPDPVKPERSVDVSERTLLIGARGETLIVRVIARFRGKIIHLGSVPTLFRKMVRAVWTHQDPNGLALKSLLGFGPPAIESGDSAVELPGLLPGGKAIVNEVSGAITWEFCCQLQRAVWDLMQERWRAMVCPVCRKLFVADRTAQRYCSPRCYAAKKAGQSLDYYYSKGRQKRQEKKQKKASFQTRRGTWPIGTEFADAEINFKSVTPGRMVAGTKKRRTRLLTQRPLRFGQSGSLALMS
jgi:hypothetical protein